MLAVVRWMFGVMLGFGTQAGVISDQPGRADMEEICIHALLRFVAAHVHLVVDLLLHKHYVVRSPVLILPPSDTDSTQGSRALKTPAIMSGTSAFIVCLPTRDAVR